LITYKLPENKEFMNFDRSLTKLTDREINVLLVRVKEEIAGLAESLTGYI